MGLIICWIHQQEEYVDRFPVHCIVLDSLLRQSKGHEDSIDIGRLTVRNSDSPTETGGHHRLARQNRPLDCVDIEPGKRIGALDQLTYCLFLGPACEIENY